MGAHHALGQCDRGGGIGNLDDKGDGAEALFHVERFSLGVAGQQRRRVHGRAGEVRVPQALGCMHHRAEGATVGKRNTRHRGGRLDGAQYRQRDLGFGQGRIDGRAQIGTHLLVGFMAFVGGNTVCRHQQKLRRGAHLARVKRQAEGHVAQHGLVGVGRVDDHGIDTGQFCIHLGLAAVLEQPVAKDGAAGKVHRLDGAMRYQGLGGLLIGRHAQAHQVRIQSRFAQHVAQNFHGNGDRKNGLLVGFDDHGIACCQGCKQAGIGIPGREG